MPPAVEAWSLNHWTGREVPGVEFFSHRRGPGGSGRAVDSLLKKTDSWGSRVNGGLGLGGKT